MENPATRQFWSSRSDRYVESLIQYLIGGRSAPQFIEIVVLGPEAGTHVTMTISLPPPGLNPSSAFEITAWSDWDPGRPTVPSDRRLPIEVSSLSYGEEIRVAAEYLTDCTVFRIAAVDRVETIRFSFESVSLLIPIPEAPPYNRHVLGFNVHTLMAEIAPTTVRVGREPSMNTKFTKGNYRLAFPSRSTDSLRTTSIYYDNEGPVRLKMGFSSGSVSALTDPWNTLILAGIATLFIAAVLSLDRPEIAVALAALAAVAGAFVRNAVSYFQVTRPRYYIGGKDRLGKGLVVGLLGSSILSLSFVILELTGRWTGLFQILLICEGLVLLFAGAGGVAILRRGRFERYVCDITTCDNVLHNRFAAWNCFATGRVPCPDHSRMVCKDCPLLGRSPRDVRFGRECISFQVSGAAHNSPFEGNATPNVRILDESFYYDERVLRPLSKTELLIKVGIVCVRRAAGILTRKVAVVDVGTGCGVVAILLADRCREVVASVQAVDVSREALEVARLNARIRNECEMVFECGDLLGAVAGAPDALSPTCHIRRSATYLTLKRGRTRQCLTLVTVRS